MQRASQQDLRRFDLVNGSSSYTNARDDSGSSYSHHASAVYWPAQGESSNINTSAPHTSSSSDYHQQPLWDEPIQQQNGLAYPDHLSVHGVFDLHYGYGTQGNSLGLKEDPGLNVGLKGDLDLRENLRESMHREAQSYESTDAMALLESLPFTASPGADNDSYEDSTDSDLPPEKKKLSAAFRPRGRKKRNKCTPDQLRSLEAFFEKNRNPTGRVRLELSRKLRMPERSVQVWFQNRRAKVKTIERRGDPGSDSGRKKTCSIRLSDKEMYNSASMGIRSARAVDDQTPSVTAIPTSALCIGTWRRVSPLICFFSRRLQSLTWYLTSESIGFKLEIPWTSIGSAYFDGPSNPSVAERAEGVRVPLGHFVIDLERPPTFFMEVFRSAPSKNGSTEEPKVSWRQCEDFTEDHQAMTVSRHVLNGPYEELRSAVQSLARCNDVLKRLIVFRDEERRALGEVPTGSGSTADNFGLVNNASLRPAGPFPSPVDGPTMLAATDVYANTMQMQMQMQPGAMASSASPHKGTAWQDFRNPLRTGEPGWEFDSPASVSTNLSEASLDSSQRHHLGYSPYGVPTSIEASPRSGFGSSVDLGSLRIDTGGVSNIGSSVPLLGDGGFASSRAPAEGWEARLGYEIAAPPQPEAQYPPGEQASSHAMQAPAFDTSFGVGQLESFDRNGGERSNYPSQVQVNPQHHVSSSFLALPKAQEAHYPYYGGNQGTYDQSAADSSSLLPSRRVSHAGASAQGEDPPSFEQSEPEALGQRAWMAPRQASDVHAATTSTGSTSRIASFEEDAFCGKTPTHRTTFGNSLQLSQMAQMASDPAARGSGLERSEWNGGERYASSSSALPEGQQDPEYYSTAQGRARSNTYRSSTHDGRAVGGAALSSSAIQACSAEDGRSGAERETLCQEDHDLVASDANGAHRTPSGPKAASPTLLSLSPDHAAAKRDPSPDDVARHTGSKLTQD